MTEDDDLELDEERIERVSDEPAPVVPLDDVWTTAAAVGPIAHDEQTVWDLQPEAYIEGADDLPETRADEIFDASRELYEEDIFEANQDVLGEQDGLIIDDTAEADVREMPHESEEELDSELDETDDAPWA